MLIRRFFVSVFPVGLMLMAAVAASGEDFPNRPIRLVASAPGGGGDFMARLIAQETTAGFGQPVIVENRTAAFATELVSRATPDGYSLVVAGSSFMIGHLLQNLSYDPVRDFSAVTLVTTSPNVLVVHPSIAANSVKELIAVAKAKPGAPRISGRDHGVIEACRDDIII